MNLALEGDWLPSRRRVRARHSPKRSHVSRKATAKRSLKHPQLNADLLLVKGRVVSLDEKESTYEALAVSSGRIVALGRSEGILGLAGKGTRVVDLKGKTVLPGFADCHVHFNDAGTTMTRLVDFDLEPNLSAKSFLERIKQKAARTKPGEWILGKRVRFLDILLWTADGSSKTKEECPHRWDLDKVSPNNPVFVVGPGNHVGLGNSKALELAGISEDTADPVGGKIVRDSSGVPNGILIQKALGKLDMRQRDCVIPSFTIDQYVTGLEAACGEVIRKGITMIHDVVVNPDEIRAYQEAARRNKLPIRVRLMIRGSWGPTEPGSLNRKFAESKIDFDDIIGLGIQTGFGDDRIRVAGVKISIDGPGGIIRVPQDELTSRVKMAHAAGIRAIVHAVTAQALPMAIEAIREAVKVMPQTDHRDRIEHCGNLNCTLDEAREVKRLGIIASPQPAFFYSTGDRDVAEHGKGPFYPFRDLLREGVCMIGGSDWPGAPPDPMLGIYSAVTRRTESGKILDASQSVSVLDAIQMYTSNAAYASFDERDLGTIETGKLADLVVLSDDPFAVPPDRLKEITADMTIVGGTIVWEKPQVGKRS